MTRPTDHYDSADIIKRLEAAEGPDRELDGLIAQRLAGWHRFTPSQLRRKHPGWIAPDDYNGRNSDGSPRLDSLHGTTIHKYPPPYTSSLDAAIALVERVLPEDYTIIQRRQSGEYDCVIKTYDGAPVAEAYDAVSQPIALLIALFKALEAKDG